MKKLLGLVILPLLHAFTNSAQTIGSDSRGKEIYSFYKSESLSLPISAATSSAKLNYTKLIGEGTQYFVGSPGIVFDKKVGGYSKSDSARLTMAKSTGLNFSLEVGNILSNLTHVSTFHPTYTASFGIGRNVDVFNRWDTIRTLRNPFYTWNVNFYGSLDNVIVYDTITKVQNRKKPVSEGMLVEGTLYVPALTNKWVHKWLISVSGSLTFSKGNNIASLKNFQANEPAYSNSQVISLGDYVGVIGDLKRQNLIRARLSFPLFPSTIKVFKKGRGHASEMQLCLIPYYSAYGEVGKSFSHLLGFYLNATPGSLFVKDSTIVSGLGIGFDWAASSSGLSNGNVFVGGSLDIHALFAHEKPQQEANAQ